MKKSNTYLLPYGREHIPFTLPTGLVSDCLTSGIEAYVPTDTPANLVEAAMAAPIGSPALCELARGKSKVVIIASDHTRPVPSKVIIPPMLREIRRGNPEADITILIATGCHRGTTVAELRDKFGDEIYENEHIVVHDCDDRDMLVNIGTLPSGGECVINRLAVEADLLVAEGFIEPHFFAGFSGGRKSVLPGVAARETVLANHCAEFIAGKLSRTGVLQNNPIHEDMCWAAERAGLKFIVNTVLNGEKETIYAVAGDPFAAHAAGCDFLRSLCLVKGTPSDIVITTNGGYPLDQNVYQAVKGMTAAEAVVKPGGVIVMLSKCNDGHGGERFYHMMADEPDTQKTLQLFLSRARSETVPDQWQAQVFIRVLERAEVIFVSDVDDDTVRSLHMTPAHSVEEAFALALQKTGKKEPMVTVIPDGVAVICE